MPKINWSLRLQNKATLIALIAAGVAFVYQGCAIFGIAPAVSPDVITEWFGVAVNILVILGIVVDPTTGGLKDTEQALGYERPRTD